MTPLFETSPALTGIQGVSHGFFGREGGRSTGVFASNNMSITLGDAPGVAEANRAAAAEALGYARPNLCMLKQVHSADVEVVTGAMGDGQLIEADAMVTAQRGLALGILTADCTPILFADPEAGVIGATHAGWRGAVDGIIGNTIAAMVALGAAPQRIVAAIGPTISGPNYEVGDQFMADFVALQPNGSRHFHTPPGKKAHFDLPGFVEAQLREAGLGTVAYAGGCTYAYPERYFSHRYATHQGTGTGRQIAIIGLQ